MCQKKAVTAEEAEDIKRSLDFLSGEVAAMRKQQRDILDLAGEIKVLRMQSEERVNKLSIWKAECLTWSSTLGLTTSSLPGSTLNPGHTLGR